MADKAITQFTEMTSPANADVFAVVDVSEALPNNQNKKLRLDVLKKDFMLANISNGEVPYRTGDDLQAMGEFEAGVQFEINAPDLYLGLDGGSMAGTSRNIHADGTEADIDIILNPKGSGTIQVPTGYESNITADEDLINKKYFDDNAGGGGGVSEFTSLTDAPSAYTTTGYLLRQNSTPDGLEWVQNTLTNVMSDVTLSGLASGDYFYYNGSVWTNYSNANVKANMNYWTLGSGNVYRTTGNVGIGTSTPNAEFHVLMPEGATADTVFFGTDDGSYGMQFKNATASTGFLPQMWVFPNGSTNYNSLLVQIPTADDTGTVPIYQIAIKKTSAAIATRPLVGFYNNTTLRTVLDKDGNWGFNVTTPTERIDVSGNIKATGTLAIASMSLTSAPADTTFSTSQLATRDSSGNLEFIAASGGGTTNFLRADGTWAAPGGSGSPGGSSGNIQYNDSSAFGGFGNYDDTTGEVTFSWSGSGTDDSIDRFTIERTCSTTPGVGFGANVNFDLENGSNNMARAFYINYAWDVTTDGSEDTHIYFYKKVGGADTWWLQTDEDSLSIRASGADGTAQIYMTDNLITHTTFTSETSIINSVWNHQIYTSGTAANGFGAEHFYRLEAAGGSQEEAASVQYKWDIAATATRSSSLLFHTYYIANKLEMLALVGGATPHVDAGYPFKFKAYTTGSPPAVASYDQAFIYDSDKDQLAYSNGADWLYVGIYDDGSRTENGATTINCLNQQQFSEAIQFDLTNPSVTWTISNLGKSALISLHKNGTADKQITLTGTGYKFKDMNNKSGTAVSNLALTLTSSLNDDYPFELSLWDSGLLDSTDKVIYVSLI